MSAKQQRLDDLKQKIVDERVCPELAKEATNMVFGEGNPDADIVFVGEAPGKKEDETGRPFVGASGKFLEEMLNGIGLKREDVYITSILKYRPPHNRDPFPKEKQDFMPYLQAQLEIIEPKLLVTLGRHSTNCFLPDLQISQAHGQPERWHDKASDGKSENVWTILPLYHPAAALYQTAMRQTLIDDFSKIPNLMK